MDRLLPVGVVAEIAEWAAVSVWATLAWPKEQVDCVDEIVVLDQVPNRRVVQTLARLRLPGQDAVFGDRLVEGMARLLWPKVTKKTYDLGRSRIATMPCRPHVPRCGVKVESGEKMSCILA